MPMVLTGMLASPLDMMTVGGQGTTETAPIGTATGTETGSGIIAATAVTDMGTAKGAAVTAQKRQIATEAETGIGVEILAETGLPATAPLLLL